MQKSILLLALIVLSASASFLENSAAASTELRSLWGTWKQINNKIYSEAEELKKFAVFVENYFKVVALNEKDEGVKYSLNQFADLTGAEFKALHIGGLKVDNAKLQQQQEQSGFLSKVDYEILGLPTSVDWRKKGGVTPVKNQQQCGSCWSFSSTGALEGLNFIDSGKLVAFSEQQLVDCDTVDQGCNGGLMANAFEYTAQKGIETEQDYPYTAASGKCQYNAKKVTHVNTKYKNVTVNNAGALKAALVVQPVSIAIEADQDAFQFYSNGVIKTGCGAALDHGVLAVGYDTVSGTEAFIVKNSWGPTWGDQGFVYIATDAKANNGAGVCGILSMPVVPLK